MMREIKLENILFFLWKSMKSRKSCKFPVGTPVFFCDSLRHVSDQCRTKLEAPKVRDSTTQPARAGWNVNPKSGLKGRNMESLAFSPQPLSDKNPGLAAWAREWPDLRPEDFGDAPDSLRWGKSRLCRDCHFTILHALTTSFPKNLPKNQ